jgi:hypothetical protein
MLQLGRMIYYSIVLLYMFRAILSLIIRSNVTVITASGFIHMYCCLLLSWLRRRSGRQPKTYVKPEAANTVFELLMMGGVSPETC